MSAGRVWKCLGEGGDGACGERELYRAGGRVKRGDKTGQGASGATGQSLGQAAPLPQMVAIRPVTCDIFLSRLHD